LILLSDHWRVPFGPTITLRFGEIADLVFNELAVADLSCKQSPYD